MSVFLSNLDDYINPSQACINPFVLSKSTSSNDKDNNSLVNDKKKKIVIETDNSDIGLGLNYNESNIKPNLIKTTTTSKSNNSNIKVASVSLNDCLACSGCVTSAEANLIADQGIDKFKQILQEKKVSTSKPTIFLIISPQSRASLTHMFNLGLDNNDKNKWTLAETFLKLSTLFKQMGVDYILDGSSAGDIALIESREEFVHKWIKNYKTNNNKREVIWSKPPTSLSVSSTKKRIFNTSTNTTIAASYFLVANEETIVENTIIDIDTNISTPLLISHCPGWICYAEKTSPQSLPYISTSKSSQQITGVIIKKLLPKIMNDNPMYSNPYIVSLQPCYDKKLEGSRLDFFHDDINSQEIDLVLSTSEVWSLLEDEIGLESQSKNTMMDIDNYETNDKGRPGTSIHSVSKYVRTLSPDNSEGKDYIENLFRCFSRDGLDLVLSSSSTGLRGGSGGYLEHIFRYASEQLLGISLWNQPLDCKVGRNTDIAEIEVSGPLIRTINSDRDDNITLKMGKAYGFRNIQSLMLKMKKGKCDLDLVEIMACPNGCNNGGGQLKVTASDKETSAEANSRIAAVDQLYATAVLSDPRESPLAQFLYSNTNLGSPYSSFAREILHTQYHSVPKLEEIAPLASKW
jgi:iron only hydrogenase large subunit-like protein